MTTFSNITFNYKNIIFPFLALFIIGIIFTLPQNFISFGIVCALSIYFITKPIKVLYISTAILSMRYFFVNMHPALEENRIFGPMVGIDIYAPWRFRETNDIFIQYSDEFVFVFLLLSIIVGKLRKKNISTSNLNEEKVLFWSISGFIFLTLISSMINQVSMFQTFFFLQLFLRPVLFIILVLMIRWDSKTLINFSIFIFSIIFFMQIIPTFIENMPSIFIGQIFFIDLFMGTFAYGLNPITVQLLFYSFCIILVNYLQTSTKYNLVYFLICMFCIISAQSGLQTAVILIALIPFVLLIMLLPKKFDIPPVKSKLTLAFGFLLITAMVLIIINSPNLPGYHALIEYTGYSTEKALEEGLFETPKFRTYSILYEYWESNEINPLVGNGPGQYLSGGSGLDNPYVKKIISNPLFFSSGLFSNLLSYPFNNFVGLAGEIGIFGYLVILYIYILPLRYVWKNMQSYHNTFWSPVAGGFIGMFFVLFAWSLFWNVFEETAMSMFYFIIAGILINVNNLKEKIINGFQDKPANNTFKEISL